LFSIITAVVSLVNSISFLAFSLSKLIDSAGWIYHLTIKHIPLFEAIARLIS